MNAIAFDTHASFKRLKDAGLNDAQAEAVVDVVSRTADLPDISQLATKEDLALLRADMVGVETRLDARISGAKSDIAGAESRLDAKIVALDAKVVTLEARIVALDSRVTAMKGELVWWIIGTGVVVAVSQTLQHILGK